MGLWDLQIGERYKLCSAAKVFNILNDDIQNISENREEYWVSETPNLKLSGRIDKSHRVGKKIIKMIDTDTDASVIYNYIESELFKIVGVEEMVSIIKNEKAESYRKGRYSKVIELEQLFKV